MAIPEEPAKSRTRLTIDGDKVEEAPQLRSVPIFQARVLPASGPALGAEPAPSGTVPQALPQKGKVPYSIRCMLPVDALIMQDVDGEKETYVRRRSSYCV